MNKVRFDVIGDPIDHSKSPQIHETVLKAMQLPYEYRKICIKKGCLADYLTRLRDEGINGFNLTMPHKQDIIPFLDYIDCEAEIFDAVNTVKVDNGKLYGYNTDGQGMLLSIKENGYNPKGKNIVILGAGGVASTIALKMALEEADTITILNRTIAKAEKIAENVFNKTSKKLKIAFFTIENIKNILNACDILINCTPLGMTGVDFDFDDLSFLKELKTNALVYDLIYNPYETKLLNTARQLGLNTLNGVGMLIYQGLLADEIFLGKPLNYADLKTKIEYELKKFKKF